MKNIQNVLSQKIINRFQIVGKVDTISLLGNGLVNKTYLVITDQKKYIFQKINHFVFKNPHKLMENVNLVTKHLIQRNSETLEIIKTKDHQLLYENSSGYYRCYQLIENSLTLNMASSYHECLEAGIIIGKFQNYLADLNIKRLNITIPYFHDVEHRYIDLVKAYRQMEDEERIKETKEIIAYLLTEYREVTKIQKAIKNEQIQIRVCHYDTKLSNILFDATTQKARCLIDLDTVMPGCPLYDYADASRVLISNTAEDEEDLTKISLNYQRFVAFTIGYLKEANSFLSKEEKKYLFNSLKTMVLELAIRFLTDYLNNDCYFAINYEKHNLVRTKTQIALYQKLLENSPHLEKLIEKIENRLSVV